MDEYNKDQLKALLAGDTELAFILIDVRRPDEIATTGKVDAIAQNVPVEEFDAALGLSDDEFSAKYGFSLSKDKTLVMTCRSGRRSARACGYAGAKGYKVVNYTGGSNEWFA